MSNRATSNSYPLLVALALALFAVVLSLSWHRASETNRGLERALNYQRLQTELWRDYSQRLLAEAVPLARSCERSP